MTTHLPRMTPAIGVTCRGCVDGIHVVIRRVGYPRSADLIAAVQAPGEKPVRVRFRPPSAQRRRPDGQWTCEIHGTQSAPACEHSRAVHHHDEATRPERSNTL